MDVGDTKIDGNVYGVVNHEGERHQIFNNKEIREDVAKEEFYKKWWFTSLVLGFIAGLLTWWNFESVEFGGALFLITFLFTLYFNPDKRFYRIGIATLVTVSIINIFPSISGIIHLKENDLIYDTLIKLHTSSSTSINIALVVFACLMFILDFINNYRKK